MPLAATASLLSLFAAGLYLNIARADKVEQVQKNLTIVSERLQDTRQQQQQLDQEIETLDRALAKVSAQLRQYRTQITRKRKTIDQLESELEPLLAERTSLQNVLSQQYKNAYQLKNQSMAKLVLNQQDPRQINRLLHYHRYYSIYQLDTLKDLSQRSQTIEKQLGLLNRESSELEALISQLNHSRREQSRTLEHKNRQVSQLNNRIEKDHSYQERLQKQREKLASLAKKQSERAALNGTAFAQAKGKLPWPYGGKIRHKFGEKKSRSQLAWEGILLESKPGAEVIAVAGGKVVFANWLQSYGFMMIIDHGKGYMSLYGHNRELLKEVGSVVKQGETIALAGSSGDRTSAGLYFEIRYRGKPVNPSRWLLARR